MSFIGKKKEKSFLRQLLFLCFSTVFFTNCISHPPLESFSARDFSAIEVHWTPLAEGLAVFSHSISAIPLTFHAVRIDLTKNVRPFTQIEKKDQCIVGKKTQDFANQYNCAVAVNMSPFGYPLSIFHKERTISGLYIVDEIEQSPPAERYAALLFLYDEQKGFSAQIIDSQTEWNNFSSVRYAFGGFWTILKNRQIQPFEKTYYDSRTALGYSHDGKMVYILVIEGENRLASAGCSFTETAQIMLALDAENAIMMDGGGSSTLVVNQELKNRDSKKRIVGNNLGFHLKPN